MRGHAKGINKENFANEGKNKEKNATLSVKI